MERASQTGRAAVKRTAQSKGGRGATPRPPDGPKEGYFFLAGAGWPLASVFTTSFLGFLASFVFFI